MGKGKITLSTKIFIIIIFALIASIFAFSPFTCDDWFWGSNYGVGVLKTAFQWYNGRYFSDLLILGLSRSVIIKTVFMTVVMFYIFFAMYKYVVKNTGKTISNKNCIYIAVFGLLLIVCVPRDIFVQTIVWASGFVNYVVPFCFIITYCLITDNVFTGKPSYKSFTFLLTFVLGALGGLIVENVTVYNIAFGAMVIIYCCIKYKKLYLPHVSYLIGAIIGAVAMFCNPIYGYVSSGAEDGYRKTAQSAASAVQLIVKNFKEMLSMYYEKSVIICVVIIVLLFCTVFAKKELKHKAVLCALLILKTILYLFNVLFASFNTAGQILPDAVRFAFFFVSAVITPVIIIICVNDSAKRDRMLMLWGSNYVLWLSLLVVSPINARCFLPSYLMLVIFCIMLVCHIITVMNIRDAHFKFFNTASVCLIFACLFSYLLIYSNVYIEYQNRITSVEEQINNNQTSLVLPKYTEKAQKYVYYANFLDGDFKEYYKEFYNIDYQFDIVMEQ